MAPVPVQTITTFFTSLLLRSASPSPSPSPDTLSAPILPRIIVARETHNPYAGVGVTPPTAIPNKLVFVIFGLIGFGFVVTGIWFFFWAKNGGFVFKKDDWEDYKSTVLRRRGPNGTLLSGASESTDLGGGSVVHGEKNSRWGGSRWGGGGGKNKKKAKKGGEKEMRYKDFDDEESQVTSSLGGTESEISAFKKKIRRGRKDKKKHDDKTAGTRSVTSTALDHEEDDETVMTDSVADAIRSYRHEKPARVGGINKQPDGSSWDGSNTNTNEAASELLSHREKTPTNTPTKVRKERKDNYTGGVGNGGIRKVVSVSQQQSGDLGVRTTREITHEDRIKSESRKLQEKGRAATASHGKRDFSFQVGDDHSTVSGTTLNSSSASSAAQEEAEARRARREERERRRQSRSPTKKMPGAYEAVNGSEVGGSAVGSEASELGTKSYRHVIPGLSSTAGSEYAEERRRKRNGGGGGGYRRGRGDSDGE